MMNSPEESRCASTACRSGMSITEFGGAGQMNPTPTNYEDAEMLAELNLSPEKLVRFVRSNPAQFKLV